MGGDLAAEWLKLRKRASTWVLGTVLFLSVLLFGYVLAYAFVATAPDAGGSPDGTSPAAQPALGEMLQDLLPENMVSNLLAATSGPGKILALVLGVMTVGSEYGWGTLKTILVQRSGRAGIAFGKLLAVGTALVAFVLAAFAAGAVGSCGVALVENVPVRWPGAGELVGGAVATWLILTTWAVLGAFLAALFRGTPIAVGVGLIYALVLEGIVASSPVENGVLKGALGMLPGQSSSSLASSFGPTAQSGGDSQAVLLLTFYVVGFSVATSLLLRARDVDD
ncbi:MAG: hypothetical protein AVDCRST_MAG03-2258 [uncultured Rubrobacteraceae bacterium]|uniref:Uncharacterized protein n=1 Tax=uncultured Rubrobacteraceae bacterium TaxID=349277 RepID=A0A6J4PK19_9ACTN|nr:MAG: hypothetical protein AVDCRST_MAG03-2258 [uncultured Rubrobacteraceae bacterium]